MSSLYPFSSSKSDQKLLLWVSLLVCLFHVLFLFFGRLWNPISPKSDSRSKKVIVQTIQLKTTAIEHPQAVVQVDKIEKEPSPIVTPPIVPEIVKEEPPVASPTLLSDLEQKKEERKEEKIEELKEEKKAIPLKNDEPVALEPLTEKKISTEIHHKAPEHMTPLPGPKKPTGPQMPKKPALKEAPVPIKKPIPQKKVEPEKIKKPEVKKQEKSEVDKKALEKEIERKKKEQQQIENEKKRIENEKKAQKEQAEREKKRQQELAAAKEAARQQEEASLNKAKEQFAKISETKNKLNTVSTVALEQTAIPKQLSLTIDHLSVKESQGEVGREEVNYKDEIKFRLQSALRLPDYGTITIKLTLDKTGKVLKVETIQSESAKNKTYVESQVPIQFFPPFGSRFSGTTQQTFTITLTNDS